MKIKYLRAKNFLSIGEEPIEIDFTKFGNIINIKGQNLDAGENSSNGAGKCFALNTPILMFDGTTKFAQNVRVGDYVMGDDSLPRRVLALGRGREMMYEVAPRKGDPYVVNKSHLLVLKSSDKKTDRYKNHWSRVGDRFIISVKDYLEETKTFRHITSGFRASVSFDRKNVLIDPYFLGLWLGDGHSHTTAITTADEVIVESIKKEADDRELDLSVYSSEKKAKIYKISVKQNISRPPEANAVLAYEMVINKKMTFAEAGRQLPRYLPTYRNANKIVTRTVVARWVKKVKDWILLGNELPKYDFEDIKPYQTSNKKFKNSLMNDLHSYNLLNNKHVPDCYKFNNKEIRLEILAGLIDTDGSQSKNGFDFINKNYRLANDVMWLARSLGLASYIKKCKKKCQTGEIGTYYRVSIYGHTDTVPVRINKKKCTPRKQPKDPLVVGISVKPIGISNYYGFQVDGNGCFLLGDFTVVHNSTCIEAIVYGLYGKLIKGLNHREAINVKAKKGLEVEVHWDSYRVIRTREPNRLQLWEGDKEISLGGMPATDALIRDKIKLDHNSFINVACFGQHNVKPFLSCTPEDKRKIAENLLSLDRYLKYFKTAKDKLKIIKDRVAQFSLLYENSLQDVANATKKHMGLVSQQQAWEQAKRQEIASLQIKSEQIAKKIEVLKSRDDLIDYQKSQEELALFEKEIEKRDKIRMDLHAILEKAEVAIQQRRATKQDLMIEASNCERELVIAAGEIKSLENRVHEMKEKKGGTCSECFGEITDGNIKSCLEHNLAKMKEHKIKWTEVNAKKSEISKQLEVCESLLQKLLDNRKLAKDKETENISVLNGLISKSREIAKIKKPDVVSDIVLLEKDLQYVKEKEESLKQELTSGGPFVDMKKLVEEELTEAESRSKSSRNNVKMVEDEIPYYDFWVKAFSDDGIRAFVIDEIIPMLNSRVNYWLQFLLDGKIQVVFNKELEETISRIPIDDDQFVYNSLSGGEHCRIDLAISQAFSYVMMLTSGACPSIVALDEVGMFADRPGIQAIYKMICELSRERQVLIITHDPDLLDLLSGYDTIELVRKNGITTLKNQI